MRRVAWTRMDKEGGMDTDGRGGWHRQRRRVAQMDEEGGTDRRGGWHRQTRRVAQTDEEGSMDKDSGTDG